MFIGKYEIEGKEKNYIYYGSNGWELFHKETFSPETKKIEVLIFKIIGKTYQERKNSLEELAKDWQNNFACLSWSYGELAEIYNYFEKNAKKYGLLQEFKENCII